MRVSAITLALLISLSTASAFAKSDVMPSPAKAPRIAVERFPTYVPLNNPVPVKTEGAKPKSTEPKEFEGKARALDGERILIGEKEIRLFGIVTPGVSSNFGPQARQHLDALLKGAVLCKVTDKDVDGRPIAFCGTVDTPDLSYEMLRQGWAMVDRKALKNNSLAGVYEKVEQEAQTLNKGLFAPTPVVTTIPVSNPANTVTAPVASDPVTNVDTKADETQAKPAPAEGVKVETVKDFLKSEGAAVIAATQQKPAPKVEAVAEPVKVVRSDNASFVERFQGLIGGLLWIVGIAGFGGGLILRDRMQLKEKRKILAAALYGELTAARHICITRSRELTRLRRLGDAQAQPQLSQLWPRIRALVYQAHVGSIGLLGSDLARRVALVYGQCADYATYYQQTALQRLPSLSAAGETLSLLAGTIDGVLDALAQLERSGEAAVEQANDLRVDETRIEDAHPAAEQESRTATNEEAHVIKERFERMASAMVGMLDRARDIATPPEVNAVTSAPVEETAEASEAIKEETHAA